MARSPGIWQYHSTRETLCQGRRPGGIVIVKRRGLLAAWTALAVSPPLLLTLLGLILLGLACRQSPAPPATPAKGTPAASAEPRVPKASPPAASPLATGPTAADPLAASSFREEMLGRVNEARRAGRRCGGENYAPAPALVWNDHLEEAARRHVKDMVQRDRLAHEGSDGSSPARRVEAAGYTWSRVGENIAYLRGSTTDAVVGWLDSPGHCANLMNEEFREMGAAVEGVYWAQVFATPR